MYPGHHAGQEIVMVPSYLEDQGDLYREDPRAAARRWFGGAKSGLFMHYGLYSLLGRGEWVMLRETIPVAKYARLSEQFTASDFDADAITDLAVEAGMKYVNITTRHHDGFCLFYTQQHDYHSVASSARRDLVAELAGARAARRLGLFLYYSYAADWWHPCFYSREAGWENARPAYDRPEPRCEREGDDDSLRYVDYCHAQIRELLTDYGPIAGIWFDPIMGYYRRPDLFPIEETYALVRSLQLQTLISLK
jgi:alpha-L-fucosidase